MDDPVDHGLRTFVENVQGYAILSLDAAGRVSTWNEGAHLLKGWTREEILGQPYSRFFGPDDRAAGVPDRLLETTRVEGSHETEGWRVRKDGTRFWARVHLAAIHGEDGGLIGYGKITKDLTEERMHMQELERSNAELERFAYVTSHDLSEPLRSIAGFSDLLIRRHADELDDSARHYLSRIMASADRMQALIDGLLAYSRAGRRELEHKAVRLDTVVADVVEELQATIAERGATVRSADLPTVVGDPLLLASVVRNLISNALKFSQEAPDVTVTGLSDDEGWEIAVADRGIGIPEEYQGKVFTLFGRLNHRNLFEGTGVGLAICERVVTRHGGSLWMEPRDGGGSVFRFRLPRSEPQ